MPSPSYLTLSFRDFGGHLLGSKPQLTGLAGATSPLLNPYLMAELVSSVLTHLARPSLLAEDVKRLLGSGVALQTHPEDLEDPAWSEVMGYHQTPYGFSFFGTKLAQRGMPDRFALLYCQPDGSWRAHGLDFPLPSDASQAVVQIFQAIESAFPAPVREPPVQEAAPNPAPDATPIPTRRLFTPMTETAFVAYLLNHFEGIDEEEEQEDPDEVDLDDLMERGLSHAGLPNTADHSPYISFDTENILAGGIEEFSDGLIMWRGEAGGDWQWPVTFFVYVDEDGELRTYVPLQGNAYDRETNEAYDNEALVNGQLPLELQADSTDMSLEICRAFGLMDTPIPTPDSSAQGTPDRLFTPMDVKTLAQRIQDARGSDNKDPYADPLDNEKVIEALMYNPLPLLADHSPFIGFDTENIMADRRGARNPLVGFHELSDGFAFWGGEAGGDWEWPVFFLIYVDGQGELRMYVPAEGNAYDRSTMEAYDDQMLEKGDLPDALKANHHVMQKGIERAFGLSTNAVEPTEAVNPNDLAQRLRSIFAKAAAEHSPRPTPAAPPSPPVQPSGSSSKANGKMSTEDCKALLEQHSAVAAMGLLGPWKRVSKKGNAQSGVVRLFEGKRGWAKLLEKDGQLTLISLSLEPL